MSSRTRDFIALGHRRRGFTLLELVITVGLLAVVLALLLYPIMSSLGYFRSATARADAQTAARLALDAMARELTEAMYVQLDMYDSSMIAFFPPLRVDPDDPNSEIVTPPRPDWEHAIRYWRALYDPTMNYNPGGHLGPGNTFYLARTVIGPLAEDPQPGDADYVLPPFATYDPWNRWNDDWAEAQNDAGEKNKTNWSAINRMVHKDVDWQFQGESVGLRNVTEQPGFPYLYVRYKLKNEGITTADAARIYRDHVVGLTPSGLDYDVSQLEFNPTVVAGEWLRPVRNPGGTDHSVYRARYPLWRLGAPYTGWAQLSDDPYVHQALSGLAEARDPFLLIYRYEPDGGGGYIYQLRAIGAFDPDSRTLRLMDPETRSEIYDTDGYPYRTQSNSFAFGVDWVDGSLRCDFPPRHDELIAQEAAVAMAEGEPLEVPGTELGPPRLLDAPTQTVYETALMPEWLAREAGGDLSCFLVPGSIQVRADTDGDQLPDRTLSQVYCRPRANSDEFQVGLDPRDLPDDDDPYRLRYGWLRLPEYLSGTNVPSAGCTFYVDFRWRDNGVILAGGALSDEKPDLICAYYRTASVLDMTITVTRADLGATAGQRVAQSAHMTRRVKLRNLLREIRYEE